jgi:hypothetical protein
MVFGDDEHTSYEDPRDSVGIWTLTAVGNNGGCTVDGRSAAYVGETPKRNARNDNIGVRNHRIFRPIVQSGPRDG